MSKTLKQRARELALNEEDVINMINTPDDDEPCDVDDYCPEEFAQTIKDSEYSLAVMPMEVSKRQQFKEAILQDQFLKKYSNDMLYMTYLKTFNKHAKASMVYCYHYLNISQSL